MAKIKLDTEEFIKRSKLIHGDKYDYSLVKFVNTKTKVKIICSIHGEFEQRANAHIGKQKQGCKKCVHVNLKKGLEYFLIKAKEIHGDKYDYSLIDENLFVKEHVKIICPEHGLFFQSPYHHINRKNKCPKCSTTKKDTEQFIKKCIEIHNNKYDYSHVNYINNKTKVKIICPIHGEFNQMAGSHMCGAGCTFCKESKGEKVVRNFLLKNNFRFTPQYSFPNCKNINPLLFDFYLPEYNLCIEFNGRQHYEPINCFGGIEQYERQKINDKIKAEYCLNNNIQLLIIKHNENIDKKLANLIQCSIF